MAARFPSDHLEGLFKKGVAVGYPDIKRDEMTFRYRKELFTFPIINCHHVARYNGYFYTAKISEVRKLAKEKH